jgi:hypothetical protein
MRFFALLIVGILLIEIGITGKLGSMLAAIIDPQDLEKLN